MTRTYDLVHRTRYRYAQDVTVSYGRLTTSPAQRADQTLEHTEVEIVPAPGDLAPEGPDHFGNHSVYFCIDTPHRELVVTRRSRVRVDRTVPTDLPHTPWEDVAGIAAAPGSLGDVVDLAEALLPSQHVVPGPEVDAFAAPSFVPGRPVGEVVTDLAHRIRTELTYKSGSTTTRTTQVELLAQRTGVCQDFAHLMIAALRARGVPARYVSGYIETRPAPGREKLRGADASHAWVSAWIPGAGWVDVDPTNDQLVDERYVTIGWGRDFRDVAPLTGVIFTEGSGSTLTVEVDLVPAGSARFV
ncbi:transglutaminase family protein [Luteimicrobium subarcticum]|uniref:Transglutaminase-like putative cysteine protease n=1 Tax=Luteimicrobium subarcticum TaxID=620910 RepID=A0A2M8W3G0_9MICO|nr:transglutaminase family protein [Luteimicrobium subarcticum]PJI85463.1 transglutaminase-like putative cysteine protease [Luteimicrobium subarcticum]